MTSTATKRRGERGGVAEALRRAIREAGRRGVTRYAIAKAAGMPQSQVGRIASGETVPKLDTAERVARAIGLRVAILPAGD